MPLRSEKVPVVVLGAGPAGLGAAWKLASRPAFDVSVIERNAEAGGNAGSFDVAGLRVDYGSHRLHPSCSPEILADIRAMLGQDLLDRPRHGRILLRGRWVHFPLKPLDLLFALPAGFGAGVLRDSVWKPGRAAEETFATVLERGLGRTICRDFYFPYAAKIWGVDPSRLDAEQARRRVSSGSISKMIRKILAPQPSKGRFFYPRNGFGAISDAYLNAAESAGAKIHFESTVSGIETADNKVHTVWISDRDGQRSIPAKQVLSTIPVSALTRALQPAAPETVQKAACSLQFRAMLLIYLVLETEQFTEFDAHYFPGSDIAITRLSEPKNYGLADLPGATVLCAELPCQRSDRYWNSSDEQLGKLVAQALRTAGLEIKARVRSVAVRRLPQAYPIYTRDYREHFDTLDQWLKQFEGLVTFGRQGLFAHDNTHHTLAMAYGLDSCLDDKGQLDRVRWNARREEFAHHVVED